MLRPTLSFGVLLSAAIAASTPLPAAAQTKGKTEAKAKGHTGDARYDYVHRTMGKPLTTDQSWVKRHLKVARKMIPT